MAVKTPQNFRGASRRFGRGVLFVPKIDFKFRQGGFYFSLKSEIFFQGGFSEGGGVLTISTDSVILKKIPVGRICTST